MEFLIILFLLVLNGIFAMYEIALVSSSKARLETLVAKGNKSVGGSNGTSIYCGVFVWTV